MNAKAVAVITVLASLLGAHFAVLLLTVAAAVIVGTLAVLGVEVARIILRDGWGISPRRVYRW